MHEGIESPYPRANKTHSARGSENDVVWQYLTLQQEGLLEDATIPSWFLEEGWLEIYEGIEPHIGAPEYDFGAPPSNDTFNRNKEFRF